MSNAYSGPYFLIWVGELEGLLLVHCRGIQHTYRQYKWKQVLMSDMPAQWHCLTCVISLHWSTDLFISINLITSHSLPWYEALCLEIETGRVWVRALLCKWTKVAYIIGIWVWHNIYTRWSTHSRLSTSVTWPVSQHLLKLEIALQLILFVRQNLIL